MNHHQRKIERTPTAEEELRRQLLRRDDATVEDDVRSLYRWATRRRFKTVQDALSRILGKLDAP
jgi:hypothetical protein